MPLEDKRLPLFDLKTLRAAILGTAAHLSLRAFAQNPAMFGLASAGLAAGFLALYGWIASEPFVAPLALFLALGLTALLGSFAASAAQALARGMKPPADSSPALFGACMTLIALIACVSFQGLAAFGGTAVAAVFLLALFGALVPTLCGFLRPVARLAGFARFAALGVSVKSDRALETAGRIRTILIDKADTLICGARMADAFIPLQGSTERAVADAAMLSSISDDTPEGQSILALAERKFGMSAAIAKKYPMSFKPFRADTRMSGVEIGDVTIMKGAPDAIFSYCGTENDEAEQLALQIAAAGGTPLLVAKNSRILGAISLKDALRMDVCAQFADLKAMGIRVVVASDDTPSAASALAAETGADEGLAAADTAAKLALIRSEQAMGRPVAVYGCGQKDAELLAQADLGVEANADGLDGEMMDPDGDPAKLIGIVALGHRIARSRRVLKAFAVSFDIAKFFVIAPLPFFGLLPGAERLNALGLRDPETVVGSAIVLSALTAVALIPSALRGLEVSPGTAVLRRKLALSVAGGVALPVAMLKAVELILR